MMKTREPKTGTNQEVGKPLGNREKEIIEHLARGKTSKVIANDLCISEQTVKSHICNLMEKLGANNRTHAVILYYSNGGNVPNLGTNCWLPNRLIGGRCDKVLTCKYPEKKTCKAVAAEITYLQEQADSFVSSVNRKIKQLESEAK